MPYAPLFSTYTQGENRVTSTILTVLERLPFSLCEYILKSLAQIDDGTQLLSFENQPAGTTTVPDAKISGAFSFWIETKINQNMVNYAQIEGHLQHINDQNANNGCLKKLIVLTPDLNEPPILEQYNDTVAWASFDHLARIIRDCIEPRENGATASFISVAREQERFLLNELLSFLDYENLTGIHVDQVLVVAGSRAWPEYDSLEGFFVDADQTYSAYICQPNRYFRPTEYIAFYAEQGVQRKVPIIKYDWSFNEILLTEDGIENAIITKIHKQFGNNVNLPDTANALQNRLVQIYQSLINRLVALQENGVGGGQLGLAQKVMILTGSDNNNTVNLNNIIENNLINDAGRRIPLTYGNPRYFLLVNVRNARTTSDLV